MSGKIKGKQLRDLTIEGLQIANDTIDADKIVETGTLSTINAGDSAVDGVAAGIARKDHQHAVATGAASGLDASSTNTEGASSNLARADHTHAIDSGLVGDIQDVGTTTAAGTSNRFARADHVHKLAAGAKTEVLQSKLMAGIRNFLTFTTSAANSDVLTNSAPSGFNETLGNGTTKGSLTTGTGTNGAGRQNYTVEIRDAASKDFIDDGVGGQVYGELEFNAGGPTWTLKYYKSTGVAHTFGVATDIDFAVLEVFDLSEINYLAFVRGGIQFSDDVTAGHNHDDLYYTETEIGSTSGTTGASLVGLADADYPNFGATPNATTDTVEEALQNINTILGGTFTPSAHASSHLSGAGDEIDGDRLDIDWNPTNYTPALVAETSSVDHLSSHLKGIDDALGAVASTQRQEFVTAQNVTGADTALTDTLDNVPVSNLSVRLYLNGVLQAQGVGRDYTVSGQTVTWLANTGTAVDLEATDEIIVVYES